MNNKINYHNLDYSRNKNMQPRSKSLSTNNLFNHVNINNNNNNNQLKKNKLNDSEINETIEKCYKNLQEIKQRFFLGEQNNNTKYFYPSTQTSNKQLKINNNNFYNNIKLESSIDKKNNINSDIQRLDVTPEIERIKKRRMSYNFFNSYHGNKTQVIKNNYNTSNNSRIKNTHFREDKKINNENKILNNFNNYQNKYSSQLYLNRNYHYKTKYNNNDYINFDSYQNKMLHKILQKKNIQIDDLIKENKILKKQIETFLSQKEEYEKNNYFDKLIECKNEIIRLKKIIFDYHRKNNHLQEQVIYLNKELTKLSKYKQTQNAYLNENKFNTEQKILNIIKNLDENEEKKEKTKEKEKYINKKNNNNKDELEIQTLVLKNKQLNEMNNLYKDKIKDYDKELNKLNITLKEKTNIIFSLERAKSQNKNKNVSKNLKIDDNYNTNKIIKTNLKINDKNNIKKNINKNSKVKDNNYNINKSTGNILKVNDKINIKNNNNIINNLKENDNKNIIKNLKNNLKENDNKNIFKSIKTNLKENEKNIYNNKENDNNNIIKSIKTNLNENEKNIYNNTKENNNNNINNNIHDNLSINTNNNINEKEDYIQYQSIDINYITFDQNKKNNKREIESLKNKLKFINNIENKYKELISTDKRSKVSLSDDNSKKLKDKDDEQNLSLIRNINELNDKKDNKEENLNDDYLNYFLEGKEN